MELKELLRDYDHEELLESCGYDNLEIILGASCLVYTGEKAGKRYLIKNSKYMGPNILNHDMSSQIQKELKLGEKLKGLDGVCCDWEKLDENTIVRPYVNATTLDTSLPFKNPSLVDDIENIISSIHKRGVCLIDYNVTNKYFTNILITPDKKIKFFDFGISEIQDDLSLEDSKYECKYDFFNFYRKIGYGIPKIDERLSKLKDLDKY